MNTLFNKIKRHGAAINCALVFISTFVYCLIDSGFSWPAVAAGIIAAVIVSLPFFLAAGIEYIYNK